MCLLFIFVDMGRPERVLHLVPLLGTPNWPRSLLTWDALVLNLYLALNVVIVLHVLHRAFHGRYPAAPGSVPLVLLSIPVAIPGNPHRDRLPLQRHGGPSVLERLDPRAALPRLGVRVGPRGATIVLFQILRRTVAFPIKDEANLARSPS